MTNKNIGKKRIAIIIPARYGSTRLPGKPLADIMGKPMIQHVYERALKVSGVNDVVIAIDDHRVADAVNEFGGRYIMTSENHNSGTDRLVEVMEKIDADLYINLQGDEPLVRPEDIDKLIKGMVNDPDVKVGTLCHTIVATEALNPNIVKVVVARNGDALYFSRSPIPYLREDSNTGYLKHVGIYGYRREVLGLYSTLQRPMIELVENLEQLRLLFAGIKIRLYEVKPTGPGVDTIEGLEYVRSLMARQANL